MTKHLELSKLSTNNLQELQDFIAIAKANADKFKGLKIVNDNDIAEVSANIKGLNADKNTLEQARDLLMEKAGINVVVEAMSYIREIRLDLNRNLTDAKLEIKESAIKLFMEHLDTLIEADKDASESFKKDFNGREIALEVIKGKSKNFNKLMNDKLQEIKTDLAVNGKQTKEKRLVMKEFSTEITYDEENLLSMSKENLRVVLEKRANDKIEREKQIAIEAKEQERKRIIEAQKQEQDIIDRENMRKDKEALAQRKSAVENKVTEEAVETEVIEEAVEIHDFAINFKGTTESAKSVARYAKEVMKITGVLLTRVNK